MYIAPPWGKDIGEIERDTISGKSQFTVRLYILNSHINCWKAHVVECTRHPRSNKPAINPVVPKSMPASTECVNPPNTNRHSLRGPQHRTRRNAAKDLETGGAAVLVQSKSSCSANPQSKPVSYLFYLIIRHFFSRLHTFNAIIALLNKQNSNSASLVLHIGPQQPIMGQGSTWMFAFVTRWLSHYFPCTPYIFLAHKLRKSRHVITQEAWAPNNQGRGMRSYRRMTCLGRKEDWLMGDKRRAYWQMLQLQHRCQ